MLSAKDIKNGAVYVFIFVNNFVMRIKIFLGLEKIKFGVYGYFSYRGMTLSRLAHNEERMRECEKYDRFRPDDVIFCTYPKTGTHFVGEVVASIYTEKGLMPKIRTDLAVVLEFIPPSWMLPAAKGAHTGIMANLDNACSPRLIFTHLPWHLLPQKVKDGKVKMIHCIRNPKDVVCSAYPFFNKLKLLTPDTTWNNFVAHFIAGNVINGSYFEHMKEWYSNRNNPNLLNLHFEDMKKDLEGNVRKIVQFLGMELADEQIDRVVSENTFENKKKEKGKGHLIYRQGKSGGWKSQFTVEQSEMMDEMTQRELGHMTDLHMSYE